MSTQEIGKARRPKARPKLLGELGIHQVRSELVAAGKDLRRTQVRADGIVLKK